MKYEVTFSCGHTGTVQLYGKGDERERRFVILKNMAYAPSVTKSAVL